MNKTASQIADDVLSKLGFAVNDSGMPIMPQSPVVPAIMGTGAGLVGAHFLSPSEAATKYRGLAGDIPLKSVEESLAATKKGPKLPKKMYQAIEDVSGAGKKVKFKAPAHVAERYFKNRALQSNAKRLAAGGGLGLLAGLLAHGYFSD